MLDVVLGCSEGGGGGNESGTGNNDVDVLMTVAAAALWQWRRALLPCGSFGTGTDVGAGGARPARARRSLRRSQASVTAGRE